jgi:hypothetical protein
MACPHVSGVVALGLSYAAHRRIHLKAKDVISMLYESVYKTADGQDPFKQSWDLDNPKRFYKYVSDLGENHVKSMDLKNYVGKMGHGQVNAFNFLNAIAGENVGEPMQFPNVFIKTDDSRSYDLSLYMDVDNPSVVVDNQEIALAVVEGGKVKVTGVKTGQTKARVSNGTETHEFVITVRAKADNNGWL